MRKVLFAIAFLPLMATAQVQRGIVRTTGNEKNVNGSPISGVIVKANGNSSKTPVEITMVSRKELNRMKTEIEEKVYQQVHKKYSETIALLNDSLNKEISSAPIVERNWGEWRGHSSFWNPYPCLCGIKNSAESLKKYIFSTVSD